jgi:hypothetical protein
VRRIVVRERRVNVRGAERCDAGGLQHVGRRETALEGLCERVCACVCDFSERRR